MKPAALLGLLCILGFSGCARHHGAALAQSHTSAIACLPPAVKSLPVRIVPSFEHPVLAWSTAGMMETYVSYNPRIADKLPREVLAFALVHEYAHLHLKHIAPFSSGVKTPARVREHELAADRFAAKFWATNDVRVAQAAAASFLSPADNRALGSEKPSLAAGYPTRKERAQAILDCLAQAPQNSAPKEP